LHTILVLLYSISSPSIFDPLLRRISPTIPVPYTKTNGNMTPVENAIQKGATKYATGRKINESTAPSNPQATVVVINPIIRP